MLAFQLSTEEFSKLNALSTVFGPSNIDCHTLRIHNLQVKHLVFHLYAESRL